MDIIMPTTRTEVADHLDKAADILLIKGQATNTWTDDEGKVCGNQALLDAIEVHSHGVTTVMSTCPVTAVAFAMYLMAEVLTDQEKQQMVFYGREMSTTEWVRTNAASYIVRANDVIKLDMAESMRMCAKALREQEGNPTK